MYNLQTCMCALFSLEILLAGAVKELNNWAIIQAMGWSLYLGTPYAYTNTILNEH